MKNVGLKNSFGVPILKAQVGFEIYNEKNELVDKKIYDCHSFLLPFSQILFNLLSGVYNAVSIEDINNTAFYYARSFSNINEIINCSFNAVDRGIVIGTSDTPNSVSSYRLEAIITSGFSVLGVNREFTGASDNTFSFKLSKTFTCNTSSLSINEVGIYASVKDSSGIIRCVCIARDVLPETVVINYGQSFIVYYTFTFTLT